jgi:hypothetical protein
MFVPTAKHISRSVGFVYFKVVFTTLSKNLGSSLGSRNICHLFSASGSMVATAAADAAVIIAATGAAADTVTGALVGVEKSDDTVLNTGGVVFTSLSVSFTASGMTAVTAASVVMQAGEATDAVTGELVGTEMFSDGADSGTGGISGADSFFYFWLHLSFQIQQLQPHQVQQQMQ